MSRQKHVQFRKSYVLFKILHQGFKNPGSQVAQAIRFFTVHLQYGTYCRVTILASRILGWLPDLKKMYTSVLNDGESPENQ
jgi:hypothetical protein